MTNSLETLNEIRGKVRKEAGGVQLTMGIALLQVAIFFFMVILSRKDLTAAVPLFGFSAACTVMMWMELRSKKRVTLPILNALCDLERRLASGEAKEGGPSESLEA